MLELKEKFESVIYYSFGNFNKIFARSDNSLALINDRLRITLKAIPIYLSSISIFVLPNPINMDSSSRNTDKSCEICLESVLAKIYKKVQTQI